MANLWASSESTNKKAHGARYCNDRLDTLDPRPYHQNYYTLKLGPNEPNVQMRQWIKLKETYQTISHKNPNTVFVFIFFAVFYFVKYLADDLL